MASVTTVQNKPAALAADRAVGGRHRRPARRPRFSRQSPAGEVVLGYLDAQAARLAALDLAVRRDKPDAVHQMRVAVRRLRSTLQSFTGIIRGQDTRQLRDELYLAAESDLGHQVLEAVAAECGGAGVTLVLVDDVDVSLGPSELLGASRQVVLAGGAGDVVAHLHGG